MKLRFLFLSFLLFAGFSYSSEQQDNLIDNILTFLKNPKMDKEAIEEIKDYFFIYLNHHDRNNLIEIIEKLAYDIRQKNEVDSLFNFISTIEKHYDLFNNLGDPPTKILFLVNAKLKNTDLLNSSYNELEQALKNNTVNNNSYWHVLGLLLSEKEEYLTIIKDFFSYFKQNLYPLDFQKSDFVTEIISLGDENPIVFGCKQFVLAKLKNLLKKHPGDAIIIAKRFSLSTNFLPRVKEILKDHICADKNNYWIISELLFFNKTKELGLELFEELYNYSQYDKEKLFSLLHEVLACDSHKALNIFNTIWSNSNQNEQIHILLCLLINDSPNVKQFLAQKIDSFNDKIVLYLQGLSQEKLAEYSYLFFKYCVKSNKEYLIQVTLECYKCPAFSSVKKMIADILLYCSDSNKNIIASLKINNIKLIADFYEEFMKTENIDDRISIYYMFSRSELINQKNFHVIAMYNSLHESLLGERHNCYEKIRILQTLAPYKEKIEFYNLYYNALYFKVELLEGVWGHDQTDILSKYQPHMPSTLKRANFIASELIKDFSINGYIGDPEKTFERNDIIRRINNMLSNENIYKNFSNELSESMAQKHISQAKRNATVLFNKNSWNSKDFEPGHYHGLTFGEIISYTVYYIERRETENCYYPLVTSLIQALSDTKAMGACLGGSVSGILLSVFDEHFGGNISLERSFRDYLETIINNSRQLKKEIFYYLLYIFNPNESNPPELKHLLVTMAPLKEYMNKFNGKTFVDIFGVEFDFFKFLLHKLESGEELNEQEQKNFLFINKLFLEPIFLQWFGENYSDMIIFEPKSVNKNKLSFPDFMSQIIWL